VADISEAPWTWRLAKLESCHASREGDLMRFVPCLAMALDPGATMALILDRRAGAGGNYDWADDTENGRIRLCIDAGSSPGSEI